jgi:hypothetical protein
MAINNEIDGKIKCSKSDYGLFLSEQGLSEDFVRHCSEIEIDRVDINDAGLSVKESSIEGLGLFAEKEYKAGEVITLAVVSGNRTEAGRYTNHSHNPNALVLESDNDIALHAADNIAKGDEITINYRDVGNLLAREEKCVQLVRENIAGFENALLSMPQIDIPIQHHFSDGIYGREMFVPAGAAFTGKIHKTEHMSILLSGEMLIKTTTGAAEHIKAPCMFISPADTKKAGLAITDSTFITIHGTHERDINKLESELVSDSYSGGE